MVQLEANNINLFDYHVSIGSENELCLIERNLKTGKIMTYPCIVCEDGKIRIKINENNAEV